MAEEKLTVCIWPYGGITHFGHVGLKLKSHVISEGECYISWWPGDRVDNKHNRNAEKVQNKAPAGITIPYHALADRNREMVADQVMELSDRSRQGLHDGTFTPRTGQEQIDVGFEWGKLMMKHGMPVKKETYLAADGSFKTRYLAWVQQPQKIRLPCMGQPGVLVGINVPAMFRWWRVFSAAPTNWYKLMSQNQNCAGVAALALRAGGAAAFAKPPSAVFYMDPNQVRDWCNKVLKRINELNQGITKTYTAPSVAWNDVDEIMTLAEWKKESEKGVSVLATRSGATKKIDEAMKQYWALPWGTGDAFDAKTQKLTEILDATHVYLAERAGHKREAVVVKLGEQVLSVIENREDPSAAVI